MDRRLKNKLIRTITAAAVYAVLLVLKFTGVLDSLPEWGSAVLFAVPYLIAGYDVIYRAFRNIVHGQVFDENFLMTVATFAAFAIGEYSESCAVMVFYQVGEVFQGYAVGRSRKSIADMMSIAPEYVNLEKDGNIVTVDPEDVSVGDTIVIMPGEKIPVDAVVTEGSSYIDTTALTGESVPRKADVGDALISGCLNGDSTLKAKVTAAYEDSTVSKILELVENASEKKAPMENFITRFSRYYTPAVTTAAVLLAVIPPLFFGEEWSSWIHRACVFLTVSCPCALVISVPLGFFGGIGAASKIGVLVKGSVNLETASKVDTLVFDKTGTLTKGEFKVTKVIPADGSVDDSRLLEIAAYGESYSTHPIARSIHEAYGKELSQDRVSDVREISGGGIDASLDGKKLLIGNAGLLERSGIKPQEEKSYGTVVYVAYDGKYMGCIVISDSIKPGVKEAIDGMHKAGIKKTVMLTGDRKLAAEAVAGELGIDEVRAELLPADKVEAVEQLLAEEQNGSKVGFAGDGINDAPVLMRADVGIAMGSLGSDAAIEAADIVIMDDDLRKIPAVMRISRKTMRIVYENVIFALAVKFIILILGALGIATLWAAVFGDVGVAVIDILNSMRALGKVSSSVEKQ
ncbi:MAG: heavy metal translocating P-type ATPase [Oscillospiraceae bacterium]|jgi:Cd2+/Zn2+-exporting ATPase